MIAVEKLNKIIDFLSVYSHSIIKVLSQNKFLIKTKQLTKEVFTDDLKWLEIEEIPHLEKLILLSKKSKLFIEKIINGNENNQIIDAINLYHNAIKLIELKYKPNRNFNLDELINVYFCSCLEVISLIGTEEFSKCKECGQIKFSIMSRVTNLVKETIGECAAEEVKRIYINRSKYLHEGLLFSSRNYQGITIPQLSSTNKSGFKLQHPMYNEDLLKDYCSYIIRYFIENRITF